MSSPLFYLIPFIYLFTFRTRLPPSRMHIHIRIYKFSTRHKAAKFEKILIEFFEKICLHFWILWQTFCCVIISKFEIASRAGTAASNHFIGIRYNDDQPKIKHHYDHSGVCLFMARVALPLWRWALAKCYFRGGAYGNKEQQWQGQMDRWMGEPWDRRPKQEMLIYCAQSKQNKHANLPIKYGN